jgi:hypothetical protein
MVERAGVGQEARSWKGLYLPETRGDCGSSQAVVNLYMQQEVNDQKNPSWIHFDVI